MSLQTPESIRRLQRKLYLKAKVEPAFRFYLLYDKICREDILRHAYDLARANRGAPGVDGVTFAAIEASDDDGKRRLTGGKSSTCGTPQGGVVSPLLANLYMNRFLKHWRATGRGEAYQARIVSYADDFVILSRKSAAEALAWTRQVMTKLGLALNEAKTAVRDARREPFDFLGYTFGPHRYRKDGHWYLGASPSKKSVLRLKAKVSDLMVPGDMGTWPEVRDRLNRLLRGWTTYFSHGTRMPAYRAVDNHVYERVRNFLARRHKVPTRGTNRFNREAVFGTLGVFHLRRVHLGPPPRALR